MRVRATCLVAALELVRKSVSSFSTIRATRRCTGGVPSTSFVCPSNCGSASRTVTTAVSPSRQSSLTISSPFFNNRVPSRAFVNAFTTPRSKPETWVPPLGVAMMLTKERTWVSYPVPHRAAMSTSRLRSTSVAVITPASSSIGTVSVNESPPVSRSTSVNGASFARKSTNSVMPPSWRNTSVSRPPPRASVTSRRRPGTRKEVWRARSWSWGRERPASARKICSSLQ